MSSAHLHRPRGANKIRYFLNIIAYRFCGWETAGKLLRWRAPLSVIPQNFSTIAVLAKRVVTMRSCWRGRDQQSANGPCSNSVSLRRSSSLSFGRLSGLHLSQRDNEAMGNGYIDHPEKGISLVLSILGAVTD